MEMPEWTRREVYQLDARMDEGTPRDEARLMIETLLRERLGLEAHREEKNTAVYLLVEVSGANRLEEVTEPSEHYTSVIGANGFDAVPAMPLSALAALLSAHAAKPVVDETGRRGFYKMKLRWTPDESAGVTPESINQGLIAALPQLGLKLQPAWRILEYLIVDKVSKEPTPN